MAYINEPNKIECRVSSEDQISMMEDEDTIYAKKFQKCLVDLAEEVYGTHEPFTIAQKALQAACDFYEADWCGMFDVDMMLDLWMPFWWYNRLTGGMTQTQLKEGRVLGSFEMFRRMIVDNASYYNPDIESIRETKPEEYALFVSQDVKSFMAVPYSRREHGILTVTESLPKCRSFCRCKLNSSSQCRPTTFLFVSISGLGIPLTKWRSTAKHISSWSMRNTETKLPM